MYIYIYHYYYYHHYIYIYIYIPTSGFTEVEETLTNTGKHIIGWRQESGGGDKFLAAETKVASMQ